VQVLVQPALELLNKLDAFPAGRVQNRETPFSSGICGLSRKPARPRPETKPSLPCL